ncbi:hypothetical protein A9Q84_16900 [Halobacteriovorax marinus]|uniref:Secreted protein n=1 Tax=Halobacteriovorax marinus TaxID=97084 RepID=A0A1Y5F8J7_9BACT|nr:hypothetical protein A9Q84_16900 [Halobacteriovorax marinus]
MKFLILTLVLCINSTFAKTSVLDKLQGTYKGNIEGKTKDCFLKASYQRSSWFQLEAYRSEKERIKLSEKKNISFSAHESYMTEKFEDEYNVYLRDVASDVSAMYSWMIGMEAKDYILSVETNNDSVPVSYEFSSERKRIKSIIKCDNLKKI